MEKYFDFIFDHNNLFIIIDNNNKIWFSGNDIATILNYKAPQRIIEKYVPIQYKLNYQDIDVTNKIYSRKYQNKSIFIDVIGLFRLSIRSKQEKAIEFQEWITDDVLPALSEKGSYNLQKQINVLKYKVNKSNKIINNIIKENDYLRNNNLDCNDKNIMYILRVMTTIRGKNKICYKLGITDDLKKRMCQYRTGNPNVCLISYFKIQNLDARIVENCTKSVLKYAQLKKNNEIFCTSLKNIYRLIQSCINNGELVKGTCRSCRQKINVNTLMNHNYCDM